METPTLCTLKTKEGAIEQDSIKSISYNLQLPLSSNNLPSSQVEAVLKLELDKHPEFSINMSRDELHSFFMQLELIQSHIDSLMS